MERAQFILDFWLGPEAERDRPAEAVRKHWFASEPAFDARIRQEFQQDIEQAATGALDGWLGDPRGRLALIVLLDQFTRNAGRGTEDMYIHDAQACGLTLEGLQLGQDKQLRAAERQFFYMPLMHSEQLAHQERCVALFEKLAHAHPHMDGSLRFARMHHDIIARFGRFPHRNVLLDRTSTGDEVSFLDKPGSKF